VRCALAARIGELAQTAQRLLEVAHWMRTVSVSLAHASGGDGGESVPHPKSFDTDLSALQQQAASP
jgi:hypothetical protein